MQVGIRELKARLSEHLAQVSQGERVIVTDRGRPIAELVPLRPSAALDAGVEAGWVEPPKRTHLGDPLLLTSNRSTTGLLDEDRGA